MRTFTVHESPKHADDRLDRAEALVFVRDGFSWGAMLLTPFWMIVHGLWLALVAYLVLGTVVQAGIWLGGLDAGIAGWMILAIHVVIGFEADAIRRWALGRRGYRLVGSVTGYTLEDCERRFFETWLKEQPFLPAGLSSAAMGGGGGGFGGRLGALGLSLRRR